MTTPYPDDPEATGQPMFEARLHLLDRQVIDVHDMPVAAVDDIEFSDPVTEGLLPRDAPPPEVTNLINGWSLATRVFGGRPAPDRLRRIPWSAVYEVGVAIRLAVGGETLDVTWPERWVRDRIIGRIPGGRHAPE